MKQRLSAFPTETLQRMGLLIALVLLVVASMLLWVAYGWLSRAVDDVRRACTSRRSARPPK